MVNDKWETVPDLTDEGFKQFLREEGVPEEGLEKEIEKLKERALVSLQCRAVLITPEVDGILREMFRFAIQGGRINITSEELEKAGEALWPKLT